MPLTKNHVILVHLKSVVLLTLLTRIDSYTPGYFIFNRGIDDEEFQTSFSEISLNECLSECNVRDSCESLTYQRSSTLCLLYDSNPDSPVIKLGTVYSHRSLWNQSWPWEVSNMPCPTSQDNNTDICDFATCPIESGVYNANATGNLKTTGAKRLYRCIEGASSNNGNAISTCGQDGRWSNVSLICDLDGFVRYHLDYRFEMSGHAKDNYGNGTFHNVSRRQCISLCKNETNYCILVSYLPENGTCNLADKRWPYISAPGWEQIDKVLPISYSFGPRGRYTLTFQDAVDYCIERGTVIATTYDVQVAYGMGYNRFDCGWVSTEEALLPAHYMIPGFWDYTGIMICQWQITWGVFCKNLDYLII